MSETAPQAILIRPASQNDIESLVKLIGALFALEADFAFDPERARRALGMLLADTAGERRVFAAEAGGRVIGMVSAQLLISTAEGGRKALLEDLVVDAAHRGQGVGRALLDAARDWAAAAGARRMDLLMDSANAPAAAFYDASGWRRTQLVARQKRIEPL